ncbi:mechanosensitive ion channel family protein [Marinicellulosiphila megalodicopiae]|uniref:mechanosensitive ion channel family protein n=1 Tax=Marinicellulosiphila megalodicopiae TaxID=2724896 RepID=UPI003BAF014F
MNFEFLNEYFAQIIQSVAQHMSQSTTYFQLVAMLAVYLIAYLCSKHIRKRLKITRDEPIIGAHILLKLIYRIGGAFFPILTILLLRIMMEVMQNLHYPVWIINAALIIAVLLFYNSMVKVFVPTKGVAFLFRLVGLIILVLHFLGFLGPVVSILETISLSIGNFELSAYGVVRVFIFGGFLFWLGRVSNSYGQEVIRKQNSLDVRTKEVFSKLYAVGLFCVIAILLLNVMGVNLTTLAVFGGAVGVGLGLGLQSIASNFISGIIILLDRSLTVGDFVELDDGRKGFVREFCMRYAVLETYDGKDILVPNEKFISSLLINWTHKDPKQRYRVDFTVPYVTNVREMVEFIKVAVAKHPQVIAEPGTPFEELPDCEIDSFGDSGVNMFVEFWMAGIDDGKNRVGGDLMLIILETLKENGIEMPFPQREVKILNDNMQAVKKVE